MVDLPLPVGADQGDGLACFNLEVYVVERTRARPRSQN